jgi:azurin
LEISLNGEALQFDQDRLQVAGGDEVILCFKNVSSLSQHNWVLVQDGTKDDVAARGLEAGPDDDWVQPGDPNIVAHTRLVKPGEEGEVRFSAPPTGTYQFVCTFPGHNVTMVGNFVVTP